MLLAATAARAFDFRAQAPTGQWVYYTVIAGTTNVKVVNPDWDMRTPPSGSLQIPSTVTNDEGTTYNVTEIDSRAFMLCDALTAVTIPAGVKSIGTMAFAFCTSLASVELPDGLTQIGLAAFSDCAFYADPANWSDDGILYLNHYAIRAQPSLTGILTVAEGTVGTANGAFEKCNQVVRIVLPSTLTMIGGTAFQNCLSMDTLELRSSTPPTLGVNAFQSLEDFTVLVPCHTANTYSSANGWSGNNIVEHCNEEPQTGIATAETTAAAVSITEGGIMIDGTEGKRFIVSDAMGRRVAESRGGYVALPCHGIYVVSTEGFWPVKIVY